MFSAKFPSPVFLPKDNNNLRRLQGVQGVRVLEEGVQYSDPTYCIVFDNFLYGLDGKEHLIFLYPSSYFCATLS